MATGNTTSVYYSVLEVAQALIRDIDNNKVTYQITDASGQIDDATAVIREHQSQVVHILTEIVREKDRRKFPR